MSSIHKYVCMWIIFLILVLVIAGFLIKTPFVVKSSIYIDGEAKKVYESIHNFREWTNWSPWYHQERDMKLTYVDGGYSWEGEISGVGSMTIVDEQEYSQIRMSLNFVKPFKSTAKTQFDIEEDGKPQKVTWTMNGNMPLLLSFMIPMMRGAIGMSYETGLKMLKEYIETGSVSGETHVEKSLQELKNFSYVGLSATSRLEDITTDMPALFERIADELNLDVGKAFSLYTTMNMKQQKTSYIVGVPVKDGYVLPDGVSSDFEVGKVGPYTALQVNHSGRYDYMSNAWGAGMNTLRAKKLKLDKSVGHLGVEIYMNNPKTTDAKDLKTEIYIPVKG